jgi:two-component system, chemotaxis family, sensor kinase CheA
MQEAALNEFFTECEEIIQRVSHALGKLETSPSDKELLDSLYRDMHTIKGTAQLFGFKNIALISHAIEACLEPIRQRKITLDQSISDILYESLDLISSIIKNPKLDLESDENLRKKINFNHSPID